MVYFSFSRHSVKFRSAGFWTDDTIPQKFRSKSDWEEITNGLKLYINKYKEECLTRRKAMTNHTEFHRH